MPFFLSDLIPFNVLLGGLDGKQVYRYNYSFFLFGFENACFFSSFSGSDGLIISSPPNWFSIRQPGLQRFFSLSHFC